MNTVKNKLKSKIFQNPGIYTYDNSISYHTLPITENLTEHVNTLYQLLGIDMTLDIWYSMSEEQQKQFERDIKIKKLLDL